MKRESKVSYIQVWTLTIPYIIDYQLRHEQQPDKDKKGGTTAEGAKSVLEFFKLYRLNHN